MTNKIIVSGIIIVLLAGLIYLGTEVQSLRAEVRRASDDPAPATAMAPAPVPAPLNPQAKFSTALSPLARSAMNDPWDPYSELARIQGQMDQLFSDAFRGGLAGFNAPAANAYQLSSDIKEEKDKYVVSMDIPGMDKSNIDVEVKGDQLTISGERKSGSEEQNANYARQERSFGYFAQSLPLPQDADADHIQVRYDKGVLTVNIPKLAEADIPSSQPTRIKVD